MQRPMGFASLYPSYKTRLRILAARGARRDAIGDALENEEGAGKAGCPQHPRSCAHQCKRQTTGAPERFLLSRARQTRLLNPGMSAFDRQSRHRPSLTSVSRACSDHYAAGTNRTALLQSSSSDCARRRSTTSLISWSTKIARAAMRCLCSGLSVL